ncbi:MAG: hypothetical protein Q9164_006344, partial [Protoblastenia rupestris]
MTTFLILCISTACIIAAYFSFKSWRRGTAARANGCRPPKKYLHKDPLLGLDLFLNTGKAIQEHRYLPELTRRYKTLGNTFLSKSLGSSSVNSIEPDNLQAVFSTKFNDWGVEPVILPAQHPFCGRGFITTDGAAWGHSRALLRPSFDRGSAIDLPTLEVALSKFINRIPRDASTVDLQPLLFSLVRHPKVPFYDQRSVITRLGQTSAEAQQFLKAFDHSMLGSGIRIALGPFKFLYRDPQWTASCRTTHQFAARYVTKAIAYRKSNLAKENDLPDQEEGRQRRPVLLYAMAEQTDDAETLRNEILQALMAAQETTAALISNVFFLLSRHQSVWRQLRHEVLSLGDCKLEPEVLQGMKFLRNVLNETLRLHPVFPQMNRIALTDTVLPVGGGVDGASPIFAPAGTMFDTSWYNLHRLPSIWGTDAEIFKPDRWETFKPGPWQFVPFGGGPRGCLGRTKALVEASFIVVKIMQEFRQIESRDDLDWTGQVQLTAKNANGCKIALKPA